MRQVVLDTETTGLEVESGHRIIEIGCVEIIDRKLTGRHFHEYVNPQRDIDEGALEVHGITSQFLADKPVFGDIWGTFLEFVNGAELIIHNAAFDIAFLDAEMDLMHQSPGTMADYCAVTDSLAIARQKHPGQKNNLDALCKRYMVDNSERDLHGALLDAEILADVYLLLTGGQVSLSLGAEYSDNEGLLEIRRLDKNRPRLRVIRANEDEMGRHELKLDKIDQDSDGSLWRRFLSLVS